MTTHRIHKVRDYESAQRACREIMRTQAEGAEFEVLTRAPSKSRDQESRYHAMILDVAKQVQHMQRSLDAESWKRLLVDAFRREVLATADMDTRVIDYFRGNSVTMIPNLDGSGVVVLGEQTRKFPRPVAAAFIEWLESFGASHGVRYSAPKSMYE